MELFCNSKILWTRWSLQTNDGRKAEEEEKDFCPYKE